MSMTIRSSFRGRPAMAMRRPTAAAMMASPK
jgi:hypothetical protein